MHLDACTTLLKEDPAGYVDKFVNCSTLYSELFVFLLCHSLIKTLNLLDILRRDFLVKDVNKSKTHSRGQSYIFSIP